MKSPCRKEGATNEGLQLHTDLNYWNSTPDKPAYQGGLCLQGENREKKETGEKKSEEEGEEWGVLKVGEQMRVKSRTQLTVSVTLSCSIFRLPRGWRRLLVHPGISQS